MVFKGLTYDRLVIHELVMTYGDAVTRKDSDGWGNTWAKNAIWSVPNFPGLEKVEGRKEIVKTRHLAIYLCRELTNNTLTSIGLFFGGRDHTTVIHACSQVEKVYKKKIAVTKFINQISKDLSVANF